MTQIDFALFGFKRVVTVAVTVEKEVAKLNESLEPNKCLLNVSKSKFKPFGGRRNNSDINL